MESRATAPVHLSVDDLQRHIRITTLPDWCASIEKVLSHDRERGVIYCAWGEFRVHREVIRDGVRFTLPGCPNALQWTLTSDDPVRPGAVIIHCTINQQEVDRDFAESLHSFVQHWREGLERCAQRLRRERAQAVERPEAAPWFG